MQFHYFLLTEFGGGGRDGKEWTVVHRGEESHSRTLRIWVAKLYSKPQELMPTSSFISHDN
jgi:hypothetical protein